MSRPRSHTLFRIVERYLRETNATEGGYATQVMREYERRVDPMYRRVQFHAGGEDAYQDMRLNAQKIKRFLTGEIKWDGDLEEAFVFALPEPWRREALEALAARYGLLAATRPADTGPRGRHATTGRLCREAGEVLIAMAPALEDGRIDGRDREHLERTLKELDDVIGAATSMKCVVGDALSGKTIKAVK